jgi:type IX secretion system PorP/SprF family membrane protein
MQKRVKIYRNPICVTLAVVLVLVCFTPASAQIREQLYHDNVVPEHFVSAMGPDVYLSAFTFHRTQWTGLSSSPKTTGLGVNYKVAPNLIAQLYYSFDQIQNTDNQNFKLGAVYSLGKDNRFKFGLRMGVNSIGQSQDFVSIDPVEIDPVLSALGEKETSFDADFSVSYDYNQLSIGLGVNNLLESGFTSNGVTSSRIFALFAQNNFRINLLGARNVILSALYKSEIQSVESGVVDVKSLLFVSPKLGLGVGYRHKESIPLLLQYKAVISNLPFVVQYSYDIQTSSLSTYNSGSHEISLRVNLKNKPIIDSSIDFEERERKSKNVRFL